MGKRKPDSPLSQRPKKDTQVIFLTDPDTKTRFERAAAAAGFDDLSKWIRFVLVREADSALGKED